MPMISGRQKTLFNKKMPVIIHAAKKIIGMKIRDLKKGRKGISKHLVIDLPIDIQDERQYSTKEEKSNGCKRKIAKDINVEKSYE